MKKKNILNLIKYHAENNDSAFRTEAYEIARYFDKAGNYQLAEYIMSLLSDANTFTPQMNENYSSFFEKVDTNSEPLQLSDAIMDDIRGIVNAIPKNIGIHKFLFEGFPGTGKTETVKHLARILERELFIVEFETIIDSKLGQTAKNIAALFDEINQISHPHKVVILFDEIDAIAIDRINSNDLREMGRATSAILKGLDSINEKIVIIATTNLFNVFDKALVRRFDFIINFNRYTREDLLDIADSILNNLPAKYYTGVKGKRLFRKIISLMETIPYPGDLKNLIKSSIAFSDPSNDYDYLSKLMKAISHSSDITSLKELQSKGFTLREIEKFTGISKSQISRELKEGYGE